MTPYDVANIQITVYEANTSELLENLKEMFSLSILSGAHVLLSMKCV